MYSCNAPPYIYGRLEHSPYRSPCCTPTVSKSLTLRCVMYNKISNYFSKFIWLAIYIVHLFWSPTNIKGKKGETEKETVVLEMNKYGCGFPDKERSQKDCD